MKIIAHRGESKAAPENTMPAFELAWQRGSKWIELDVHLTVDGAVVVHHDYDTSRMTGEKLVIAESTYDRLRQLDFGVKKSRRWKNTTMPRLEEVIQAMPRSKGYGMLLEIKSLVRPAIVKAVKKIIDASGRRSDQFVIMSFNEALMRKAGKEFPDIETRLLVENRRNRQGKAEPSAEELARKIRKSGLDSIGPAWRLVESEFVATMKADGITIHPWTIDNVAVARRLIVLGVDSLTSNCPRALKQRLAKS